MRRSGFLQRWKRRISLIIQFLLPDRMLRYFPPDFVMRDPAMSLLNRARKRGSTCGVIVLHLDGLHKIMMAYPEYATGRLHEDLRSTIMTHASGIFGKHLIVAKQMQEDNYCLFIGNTSSALAFEEMAAKTTQFRQQLSKVIRSEEFPELARHLQIQSGVHLIDFRNHDTETAARVAYYYALEIATRKLPSQFSMVKSELLNIIEGEDITVLAQPIILLSSGEIFGWEILTRGPEQSPFHRPDQLFEFAYQADLLSQLEFLIFRKAFEKIASTDIQEQVFLNLTAVTLCHPMFEREITQLLHEFPQIKPERIVFELTERHFIRDYIHTASIMRKLRQRGFRFAIDDAGSGYSSLQTISELIPDIIKIDKSVIQNIDQQMVKESLLKALLTFARNINCKVIAEGVERAEEADVLAKNDVHLGQGFYFAKPTPLLFSFDSSELDQLREAIRSLGTNRPNRGYSM